MKGFPGALLCALLTVASMLFLPPDSANARQASPSLAHDVQAESGQEWRRLKDGEVIVESDDNGATTRFVVAKILIDDSPESVWRILTNPFEFQGKISPRMKEVEMLEDKAERSVMRCRVEVFPPVLSFITYTVESEYRPCEEIVFKRIGGTLKDFKGSWALSARENGRSTVVKYSMYVDPGLPVPQWLVRKAVRMELPRTLTALRDRIRAGDTAGGAQGLRSTMAAGGSSPAISAKPPGMSFGAEILERAAGESQSTPSSKSSRPGGKHN